MADKKALNQLIDSHCNKLKENYKTLIRRGQINDESVQRYEELQLNVAVENIIRSTAVLLDIVNDVRMKIIAEKGHKETDNQQETISLIRQLEQLEPKDK